MSSDQLAQTCKLSGARWGVWVKHIGRQWIFGQRYNVSTRLELKLGEYLARPIIHSWLSGSFNTRRARSRSLENERNWSGCVRLFAFAHPSETKILLIGADDLPGHDLGFFKILSMAGEPMPNGSEPARQSAKTVEDSYRSKQLNLMSDLALAAANDVDSVHASRLIVEWLCQAFQTNLAAVLMDSGDGKNLIEYGTRHADFPLVIPIADSLAGYVFEIEESIRIGAISQAPRWLELDDPVNSVIVSPMKFGGRTVGVIAVENIERDWFTAQDENFLSVIATQIAGMLVHVHTLETQRDWATKLNLIHRVVMKIVGLTNVDRISQMITELSVEYFGYGIVVNTNLSDPCDEQRHENIICIPLREGDQIIGSLVARTPDGINFSKTDQLTLESLAGILSSVLMNARRYRQLREKINQLQLVRKVALDIVSDLDLDALLTRIVHRARELVRAKGAELGLVDQDAQAIRVQVNENPWYNLKGHLIPSGKGMAGQIYLQGEPVNVADYNPWSERLWPDTIAPFKAVAGVPLKYKGDTMGTLVVMDDDPDRVFTDEDVQLLELLAPSIVVSLRNAELYKELNERIEAQQLAERRLIQSEKMAAAGKLMAAIAHEVNNPLQSLSNCLYLVDRQELSISERHYYLDVARTELERLSTTVQRMLDLFRPGGPDRKQTDFNELIKKVTELLDVQLRDKDVEVILDLEANLPKIMVVPNQIHQVLLNLILNAIDAMPDGGQIHIHSGRVNLAQNVKRSRGKYEKLPPKNGIEILIRDSGPGVPKDQQEFIFEPFVSTKETGTGLGLTVSYEIIQAYDGSLTIIDDDKPGACFRIAIPEEQKT